MARRRAVARDRWLMVTFGLLAASSLALAGWQVSSGGTPPPTAYHEITVTPRLTGSVSVAVAGDTMFGDGAADLIATQGLGPNLAGVAGMLSEADVAVVNLEAPVTAQTGSLMPGAQYSYASPPEAAAALAAIGVDVFQLGNNHTLDRGAAGLADTIANATAAGAVAFGAGPDRAEATRPVLVRTGGLTVGLVSLGEDYGVAKRSGDAAPGMVPFSADVVLQELRVARRAGADRVIALAHWGGSYSEVDASQRYWAAELVAAGYDAVIGTGPHVLQPVEVIQGVPVAYSIGNFVFDSPGRFASFGQQGLGAVATLTFDTTGGTLALRCLRTDNAVVKYVPRECDAAESAMAASQLGGGLTWQGATGTLRF